MAAVSGLVGVVLSVYSRALLVRRLVRSSIPLGGLGRAVG